MSIQSRTALKAVFEQGDIPQGNDYSNLIDSCANLADTGEQSFQSNIYTPKLITGIVSAASVRGTNIVAATVSSTALSVIGSAVVGSLFATTADISVLSASNVSANSAVLVSVSTSSINTATMQTFRLSFVPTIVSATGVTQGTAAALTIGFSRLQGVTDGSATGFGLPDNPSGHVFYLANETSVSANLWPPTGGTINALGANAAFPLAAKTSYVAINTTSAGYFVK